jgi:hypothetical protein
VDCLGPGEDGEYFAPGFPVFSKVAWMFIDPVDLSSDETRDLIHECTRALQSAEDEEVGTLLRAIRELAEIALKAGDQIRFEHP